MSSIYIGEEYMLDPASIEFEESLVKFNRKQTKAEFEATKLSIAGELGQLSPIIINSKTGLCEDGRHRVKACKYLGIDVKCIRIDGDLDYKVRLESYNVDAMSGRILTVAQRAIQAHKYAIVTGLSLDICAAKFNIDKRQVHAANTIAGLKRTDIFDSIMETKQWVKPDGKPTTNLKVIASLLKLEDEKLTEAKDTTDQINYEDMVKTQAGKAEFWGLRSAMETSYHEKMMVLVKMLNYQYQLVIDKETGEVKEPTDINAQVEEAE